MLGEVNADRGQRFEIDLLNIGGRRLEYDLELRVLVEPVGVLSVAAIGGASGGLRVRDVDRLRTEHAQEGVGRHGAGAHLNVIGLLKDASAFRPEGLQPEQQLLKGERFGAGGNGRNGCGHSNFP